MRACVCVCLRVCSCSNLTAITCIRPDRSTGGVNGDMFGTPLRMTYDKDEDLDRHRCPDGYLGRLSLKWCARDNEPYTIDDRGCEGKD